MSDFQEIISTKIYLLFEGTSSFKYGADLNHYLTDKKGCSHYNHRIYYDVNVKVEKKPKEIPGSEIKHLYSAQFELKKIEKGINVRYKQREYFFNADHIYLDINAKADHVQSEGQEMHGDFVDVPVMFVMHYEESQVVCKKDIPTGQEKYENGLLHKEYTTGAFIEGTEICETEWRLNDIPPIPGCIKDDLTGEREHRDNCYRLEYYSGQLLEDGQTCETYWGEWICECEQNKPTGNEKNVDGELWKEYFNKDCSTFWEKITPPPPPPPPPGCLPFFAFLFVLFWAGYMVYLALKYGSFMPILFGIGIPLFLIGLGTAISRMGKFSRLFGTLLKWSLNLLLLVVLLSALDGILNVYESRNNWQETNKVRVGDTIEVTEVNPNNENNSNAVSEENEVQKPYKLVHLKWEDNARTKYNGTFKLLIEDINRSSYNLKRIESENYNSFTNIYSSVYEADKNYLDGLYQMLDSIKEKNQQSSIEFANTVVSMVQSIEYVLVLDKSCSDPYNRRNPIIRELLDSGIKCVGPSPFGLKTPTEFLATTHGDCDTRTLLLYTIFKHYKFDVAIINSEFYGHSMLGLNIGEARGMYKSYNGKKYYFWETTQIGPRLGELQREVGNVNYWKITLN
tara:strand:+ start:9539 stop:11410 length:1872 start_codon:yes stop_codon:yes gene_type:complete